MWGPFMRLLDREPQDPMTPRARYQDVTLAVARGGTPIAKWKVR